MSDPIGIGPAPDMEFPYPYICTYSPIMRLVMQTAGKPYEAGVQRCVEDTIRDVVENHPDVAMSLKFAENAQRQIDIRKEPGSPVILKVFIGFSKKLNVWRVWLEGADEQHWEKGQIHVDAN